VILAALLFLYILAFESRDTHSAARPQEASLLPLLEPSKVTQVEIVRSNSTIRAELLKDQWQLTSPPYPAQVTAIDSFLQALAGLTRATQIPVDKAVSQAGGLAQFGLNPPQTTILLQQGTNSSRLFVGSKTLVGDQIYVRPDGDPSLYTTSLSLLQYLPASVDQWRHSKLVHLENLSFDRIAITAGSRPLRFELDRTNHAWRMIEPMATRADLGRVEDVIQKLRGAPVSRFVTDDAKANLEPYGLQPPEAELILSLGTNPVFRVQFGRSPANDPTQVFARRLSHTNVVLVSRELVESITRPFDFFRDRTLLSFPAAACRRIEVHADQPFVLEWQTNAEWQIVAPFRAPADRQLMQLFLESLSKLEIIRFERDADSDFAPYGLVPPRRRYVLQAASTNSPAGTHQVLAQVDFGISPTNEFDKVFCRRPDESSVYVVRQYDMFELPAAAFSLRDRRIWEFASSNFQHLTIGRRGQVRELTRDPVSRLWFKDDQVEHAAIEETLHRLGELQADSWVARGREQVALFRLDGSDYRLTLDLNENGRSRQLTLALRVGAGGRPYAAVVLDEEKEPVVFHFPVALYALVAKYLNVPTAESEL
jgi:hypothetical protein